MLDGKQRGITFVQYVNNEFFLVGLDEAPEIYLKGEKINLRRKYFRHLPEDFQMKILDFQIEIAMLENAPTAIEALFLNVQIAEKAYLKLT